MSHAEVAIARSHIGVWKAIAQATAPYALVLETMLVRAWFGRIVDEAWREMEHADQTDLPFDVLYISYKEARYRCAKRTGSKKRVSPRSGSFGICRGMSCQEKELERYLDSFLAVAYRYLDQSQLRKDGCTSSEPPSSQPALDTVSTTRTRFFCTEPDRRAR